MASKRISELAAISSLDDDDVMVIIEDGVTKKVTVAQLRDTVGVSVPAGVNGLAGWWDASDAATITESGGAVSQWDDKSGNGYHVVQATGGNKPTTGARTINSLNALDFDGGDFIQKTSALLGERVFAIYMVIEPDTVTGSHTTIQAGATGSSDWNMYMGDDDFNFYDGVTNLNLPNVLAVATPILISVRSVGVGAARYLRAGGVEGGAGGSNYNGYGNINIGADNAGGNPFDGAIAEVIWFSNPVSRTEDERIREYLADKWNVTA